jgi:hypothetical protein
LVLAAVVPALSRLDYDPVEYTDDELQGSSSRLRRENSNGIQLNIYVFAGCLVLTVAPALSRLDYDPVEYTDEELQGSSSRLRRENSNGIHLKYLCFCRVFGAGGRCSCTEPP